MKKEHLEKLGKNVGQLREKATQLSHEAIKTAGTLKGVVQTGVEGSKHAIQKATKAINKNSLGSGLEYSSKGVEIASKGAKLASHGAMGIAKSMEKASQSLLKISQKLKNKEKSPKQNND